MVSSASLSRLAFQPSRCMRLAQRRGFAAVAAAPATSFETYDAAGVKVASRDLQNPIARLAVVAKAGTKYQPLPGLTYGLEQFAFKNTRKRSGLRITRESELLGGQLASYHTREGLVLEASFLRQHFPYFAELLAEVVSETKYTTHEFEDIIREVLHRKQASEFAAPAVLALDAAHSVAFHTGLGSPLYPSTPNQPYLEENTVAAFAEAAYVKGNIAVVAEGVSQANVSQYIGDFFKSVPSTAGPQALALNTAPTKYFGGEQRVAHGAGSSAVIAFPGAGANTPKPELDVLAALLGGQSSIKWSAGFSLLSKIAFTLPGVSITTNHATYSDAGLFTIQINGPAASVRKAAVEVVQTLEGIAKGTVAKEDVTKAIAKAKFEALDKNQVSRAAIYAAGSGLLKIGAATDSTSGLDAVTVDKLKTVAKSLLDGKASFAAVGDLHALPFAEELGLRV